MPEKALVRTDISTKMTEVERVRKLIENSAEDRSFQ